MIQFSNRVHYTILMQVANNQTLDKQSGHYYSSIFTSVQPQQIIKDVQKTSLAQQTAVQVERIWLQATPGFLDGKEGREGDENTACGSQT